MDPTPSDEVWRLAGRLLEKLLEDLRRLDALARYRSDGQGAG